MGSVWKRLQRVNKRAAKFQFTVSYHQVILETTPRWQPNRLSVVWARRSRRVVSEALQWEPTMKDPLCGVVIWPVPENKEVAVTLFKDPRTHQLEDKDWTFVLEDVASNGKRRQIATCSINMKKYASVESSHQQLTLNFKTTTKKIVSASLECTLFCVFLREGKATDEDMQSMASLMSTNNNSDIAPLDDFDEEDDDSVNQTLHEVLDFSAEMDKLTYSLSGSEFASTPMSVPSLTSPRDDPTPVASDGVNDFGFPSSGTKTLLGAQKETTSEETAKTDQTEKVLLNLTPLSREEQAKNVSKSAPLTNGKESVTGQDLLEWCRKVTAHYPGVRVTNLTTSWRNGLAFCAVINHFRPDLVEMDNLNPHDVRQNCKIAFDAGEILGIPRVIEPADMDVLTVPDKLAVITYLCQLRAHFTGHELEVQQIGKTADESSYMVGRFTTDDNTEVSMQLFGQEIQNLRKKETLVSKNKLLSNSRKSTSTDSGSVTANDDAADVCTQPAQAAQPAPAAPAVTRQSSLLRLRLPLVGTTNPDRSTDVSPSAVREVKDKILASSKSIIGKVLSPSKEKVIRKEKSKSPVSPTTRPVLMTRRQLNDPFGSDEEDEGNAVNDRNARKPGSILTRSQSPYDKSLDSNNSSVGHQDNRGSNEGSGGATPDSEYRQQSLLSRHDELKERARQLFEQARRESREAAASRIKSMTAAPSAGLAGQPTVTSPLQTQSQFGAQGEEERLAQLRERARKLIAEAKMGVVPGAEAPAPEMMDPLGVTSNLGVSNQVPSPSRTPSQNTPSNHSSPCKSKESSPVKGSSSLHSFTSLIDRISPDKSPQRKSPQRKGSATGKEGGSYIQNELEALEREQKQIDEQAAVLEKELRNVMESGNEPQREEELMSQWFTLVNKKNALIRRQMQLNILEKEDDLERRSELLARELRSMIMMEDWQKSEEQKFREALLLEELLLIVNKRDELVHHLDSQEKAIQDDDEIEKDLIRTGLSHRNKSCVIS